MFGEKKLYFAGIVAAIATVTIWATFLIGTRFAVSGNLTVDEVLVLRLVPAFIIMTPIMLKVGIFLKDQSIIGTLMIALGASAVFPYLISSGRLRLHPCKQRGELLKWFGFRFLSHRNKKAYKYLL